MSTKLITPVGTLSYPHLDEPQEPQNGEGKAKYSIAIVWAPGTDLTSLQQAVIEAAVGKWGNGAIAKLKSGALRNPLRTDAESKGYPEGSTYLNARSEQQPGMVFPWPEPGTTKPAKVATDKIRETFYPGAKIRVSVSAFAYDKAGNKGVSFGLNNVQLIDGTTPRLDGRKRAEDEFETEEGAMAPADLSDVE